MVDHPVRVRTSTGWQDLAIAGPQGPQGPKGDPGPVGSGAGDVTGPASSVDNRIAVYNGTTGKLIKDGGKTIAEIVTAPGGATTQVQFNNAGAFAGVANMTYDKDYGQLRLTWGPSAGTYGVTGLRLTSPSGHHVVLQGSDGPNLYITDHLGSPIPLLLGTWRNPYGGTFIASTDAWTINSGQLVVQAKAGATYGTFGLRLTSLDGTKHMVLQATDGGILYLTNQVGTSTLLGAAGLANPYDGSTFAATADKWTINSGQLVVAAKAGAAAGTAGIKLIDQGGVNSVVLNAYGTYLYPTTPAGNPAAILLQQWVNVGDGSALTASIGNWTVSAGKFNTAASVAGAASIKLPHGVAPTAPVDGDMWTTTASVFARINGATIDLAASGPVAEDDVQEFANVAAFPATGTAGIIYVAQDTNKIYRWTPPVVATYVTWNPATVTAVTLSGGNLVATNTGTTSQEQGARIASASSKNSGKYYFEATFTTLTGGFSRAIGIGDPAVTYTNLPLGGVMATVDGDIWVDVANVVNIGVFSAGQIVGFAVDLTNMKIWVRKSPSGNWNNSGTANPATNTGGLTIPPGGSMMPICTFGGTSGTAGNVFTANFGASAFTGAVPSGFTAGWPV